MQTKVFFVGLFFLILGSGLLFFSSQPARAYPEFAARTGETCGVCHFNAAGGGPRTPRGDIWVLDGKPDHVLDLPGAAEEAIQVVEAIIPTGDAEDLRTLGGQLYETFTCDNCHGIEGEGSAESPPLNVEIISAEVIVQTIRTGPEDMPAIPERMLPEEQIEAVVFYVQSLASERIIRVERLEALGPIIELITGGGS